MKRQSNSTERALSHNFRAAHTQFMYSCMRAYFILTGILCIQWFPVCCGARPDRLASFNYEYQLWEFCKTVTISWLRALDWIGWKNESVVEISEWIIFFFFFVLVNSKKGLRIIFEFFHSVKTSDFLTEKKTKPEKRSENQLFSPINSNGKMDLIWIFWIFFSI